MATLMTIAKRPANPEVYCAPKMMALNASTFA